MPNTKNTIAERVARPELTPNVVKKRYKDGSPGAARRAAGTTLTALKASINEYDVIATVMVNAEGYAISDEHGNPVYGPAQQVRNSKRSTARRRYYVDRGLLGVSNIGPNARQARDRYAACNRGAK